MKLYCIVGFACLLFKFDALSFTIHPRCMYVILCSSANAREDTSVKDAKSPIIIITTIINYFYKFHVSLMYCCNCFNVFVILCTTFHPRCFVVYFYVVYQGTWYHVYAVVSSSGCERQKHEMPNSNYYDFHYNYFCYYETVMRCWIFLFEALV